MVASTNTVLEERTNPNEMLFRRLHILKTRVIWADSLRILATFAVVMLHTSSRDWYTTPVASSAWHALNIYDSLVRWCVPVFFMLSGVFFLDPSKEISTRTMFSRYILRILFALIFWGLVYGLVGLVKASARGMHVLTLANFVKLPLRIMFGPPWYHLWFLYAIVAIYLLTPILRLITKTCSRRDLEYILVIFFIFGAIMPSVNYCLHLVRPSLRINLTVMEATGYLGYFFAGFYFAKYELQRRTVAIMLSLGAASLLVTILLTSIVSLKTGKAFEYAYGYTLPTTMLASYAVFIVVRLKFKNGRMSERMRSTIVTISGYSFGIYLIHDLIIILFELFGVGATIFHPFISIPILSVANFIVSVTLVAIVKKIPWFGRNVV